MRKGTCVGSVVVRLMLGLVAAGAVAVLVKEMPALRRYLKAESM
ncbi:DUF6893 family small protein [Actinomadura coerulea]|uniref:Uncharacterized protein n=1 Tax=Actinomadura coerulea TaxID=46159 RepID=A0A7X0G5V6_9ACTN|nr:hypothetical protein [Actinomadura coerulea]MBB6399973.1 hypothetical protein [Actinomadura coerulea]GGQ17340.1 hypothetical protein GCM10010187_37090 [Actinomadura coerulea]